jgi:hypothetical protein
MSSTSPWAALAIADATPNTTTPATNSVRRPKRSPSRPPSGTSAASASTYALTTHCRPVSETWSSRWMLGSATVSEV